jgi:hypothetical protein
MGKRKREATAEEIINSFGADERALALYLRDNPAAFAKHVCGIDPHPKQAEFLSLPIESNMHVMLPWGRQEGKSLVTSLYIAHRLYAKRGFRAYIFSPSEDQSRAIFNDVVKWFQTSEFLRRFVKSTHKGDILHVGDEQWGAYCELVKIGFEGRLGRSRSTRGNGVIVYDEFAVLQSADVVKGALSPITASGGGEIILSSPGDLGGTLHQLYEHWKAAEKANPRYRVIECHWSETKHVSPEWVADQRAEYEARGALWQFEREIEGKWVAPANVWFPYEDLARCIVPRPDYNPRDQFVWAMDLGGRGRSAFVVVIARYEPTLQRLEVVEVLQFYHEQQDGETSKYYRDTSGATVIRGKDKWGQIEDILLDLRDRYPPTWVGVDPATENSLTGRLENVYHFPISPILIGGYSKKLALYTALQAGIRAQKLVWNHSAITDQLRAFCPRRKETTGTWDFPTANTDIVVCAVNLYQYLGAMEITPWAIATANRERIGMHDAW